VDFTTINTTVSTDFAADRRCSLCAEEIGYWVLRAKLQQMQQLVGRYLSCTGEVCECQT
jgi:hypothetical protein